MRLIARVAIVLLALIVALFVAANVYMIVDYWPDTDLMLMYGLPHGSLASVVGMLFITSTSGAFIFYLVWVAGSEILGLRQVWLHVGAGIAMMWLQIEEYASRFRATKYGLFEQGGLTLIVTGLALGLVYWTLAGRKAGLWKSVP